MRLEIRTTSKFERDYKQLKNKHVDLEPLKEVIRLISNNDEAALKILRQRHNMHHLKGKWAGSHECHIANFGDWLLVWKTSSTHAVLQRTGSHDSIFR